MPTLVVVRHAKADRPGGVEDVDRALLPRGRADARATGDWVAQQVGRPDLVVASHSTRTRETVEQLLRAWAEPPAVELDERVYEARLGDLLAVVRGLDEDAATVALVGHNPGVSYLVAELTGVQVELSTSGVVVLEVPSVWADTASGAARLVAQATPRGDA